MALQLTPTGATCGAIVEGVDLRELDPATWRDIEDAWHRYGVLVFRGQSLSEDEQVAFARRFGALEDISKGGNRNGRPDLSKLANRRADGTLVTDLTDPHAKVMVGNQGWHADSSFRPVPAKASVLSAHVLPSVGGETEFADMRAAYDALDPARRRLLEGRLGTHSYAYSQGKVGGLLQVYDDAARAEMVPVEHPLIGVHPATGRRSLRIGRHVYRVSGLPDDEAQALLAELLDEACQPPRLYAHRWQVGDVAVWDNRCLLHRARPWPLDELRVMWHTRVAGDGPNAFALVG